MGDDVSEVEGRNGVKRRRVVGKDDPPCVEIHYRNLTKECRRRLQAMMEDWSTGQTTHAKQGECVESGRHTYWPTFGGREEGAVLAWEDLPLRHLASHHPPAQTSTAFNAFNAEYEEDNAVPSYDRLVDGALGEAVDASVLPKEAPRCWNCGSYTHGLRECPRPRDQVAISAARQEQQGRGGGGHMPRYHGEMGRDAAKNFEDLKPGVLTAAVREALGIGESAPPPWLQQMREIGYPPGYLGHVASESDLSLAIIDGSESPDAPVGEDVEEGELSPGAGEIYTAPPHIPDKPLEPLVLFPGVNAPPPPGANLKEWATRTSPLSQREEWGHTTSPFPEDARGGWGGGYEEQRQPLHDMQQPFRYPYGGGTEYTVSGYGHYAPPHPHAHAHAHGRPLLDVPSAAANAAWIQAVEPNSPPPSSEVGGLNAEAVAAHRGGDEELSDMELSD